MRSPASVGIHTIAWIVTGFPPEISSMSLGNEERVTWISEHGNLRLVVLAPEGGPGRPSLRCGRPAAGSARHPVRGQTLVPIPPHVGTEASGAVADRRRPRRDQAGRGGHRPPNGP